MATLSDVVEQQEETNLRLDELDDRFLTFFRMVRADKLDMLEMMRELKPPQPAPLVPPIGAIAPAATPTIDSGLGKLAIGTMVALPALVSGFVSGVFDSLKVALKAIKFNNLFAPITRLIESTFGKESRLFKAFDDVILKTYVLFDDYLIKPLGSAGRFLTSSFAAIKTFFDPAGLMGKILNPITSGIKAVGSVFGSIGATFAKFFGAFSMFGAVLGRLFVPIGIILSVVDTIKGAIAGFTEEEGNTFDKLIAGAFGGMKGLINGLVMLPLDLLKSGVSWISEKLGFNNFSSLLDSFSFQEMFSNMIDGVTEVVQKIFKFPQAVGAASSAALGAALPGGESPVEAFTRVFTETMNSPSVEVSPSISANPTGASLRREMIERSTVETIGSSGGITVINNTNAPSNVSSSTVMGGDVPLPSPTQSNGTRADAYSGV